jgi:Ran GTPase-activating protein (RanGAP) involved in mRNA processing and transport
MEVLRNQVLELERSRDLLLSKVESKDKIINAQAQELEKLKPRGVSVLSTSNVLQFKGTPVETPTLESVKEMSGNIFTEYDDDVELLKNTFQTMDRNNDSIVDKEEFENFCQQFILPEAFKISLVSLYSKNQAGIDEATFRQAALDFPRVQGQRIHWVRSLGINSEIARHLAPGILFNELACVKQMTREFISNLCQTVIPKIVEECLLSGVEKLRHCIDVSTGFEEANGKFCGGLMARYASLDQFYEGPERMLGTPNPNVLEGMQREHCTRGNASDLFCAPNYNVTTRPDWEWQLIFDPDDSFDYPHTPQLTGDEKWKGIHQPTGVRRLDWKGKGRSSRRLESFMTSDEVKAAGLRKEEVLALRLYTGPMYILYNAGLRQLPQPIFDGLKGNRYETTVFAISSGVMKIAKATRVPPSRTLYRGLGGAVLPPQFWRGDAAGFRGGVELGLMSTTSRREVALQYSGGGLGPATVFEIQAGRIDLGGSLRHLSQYPSEDEFLMPPLTCLEVVGPPRLEIVPAPAQGGRLAAGGVREVVVFSLRPNVNLKGLTIEQLVARRKGLHLASARSLGEELALAAAARHEAQVAATAVAGSGGSAGLGLASALVVVRDRALRDFADLVCRHEGVDATAFNNDELYKAMTAEAVDAGALALRKMDVFAEVLAAAGGQGHGGGATQGGRSSDELERVLDAPLAAFANAAAVLQLRAGLPGFPWREVVEGRSSLDFGGWSPAGCEPWRLEIARIALAAHGNALRVLVRSGAASLLLGAGGFAARAQRWPANADFRLAEEVGFLLSCCTAAAELDVSGNHLGYEGARMMSKALPALRGLVDFNYGRNGLGRRGVKLLSKALAGLTALRALNLERNKLDQEAVVSLARALRPLTGLETLRLGNCQVGPLPPCGVALAEALTGMAGLQHLDLGFNFLSDFGLKLVLAGLTALGDLRSLSLQMNGIGIAGAQCLATALPTCSSLRSLNLDSNDLQSPGMLALAASLQSLTLLTHLSLQKNKIGPEGCRVVTQMLPQLSDLQSLLLGHNSIGEDGGEAILQVLPRLSKLEVLKLMNNSMGKKVVNSLKGVRTKGMLSIYLDGDEEPDMEEDKVEVYGDEMIEPAASPEDEREEQLEEASEREQLLSQIIQMRVDPILQQMLANGMPPDQANAAAGQIREQIVKSFEGQSLQNIRIVLSCTQNV